MTVTTFQSRWGAYKITEVRLACLPEKLRGCDGTVTQRVVNITANDISEAVTVASATLFKDASGKVRSVSYDGQRRTMLKPQARKVYRSLLQQGYSLEREWLEAA